jgi:hypothetical protein
MKHLSPLDYQALLEGCPTHAVEAHLEECNLCQAEFAAELRAEGALLSLGIHVGEHKPLLVALAPLARRGQPQAQHRQPPAQRETSQPPSADSWDEISSLRATGSSRGPASARAKRRYQDMLFHAAFAAASSVLPWFTFSQDPTASAAAGVQPTLESRCLSIQPWCR